VCCATVAVWKTSEQLCLALGLPVASRLPACLSLLTGFDKVLLSLHTSKVAAPIVSVHPSLPFSSQLLALEQALLSFHTSKPTCPVCSQLFST
jgi:hypothetical protein